MEIIKNVQGWGNSAGVLLPREWLGKEVQIVLIDRTLEIKKEIFNILSEYLYDIIGIYLTGSYARNEQEKESDIDIIAISKNIKKLIISDKYHISIIPIDAVKKSIKKNPISIIPRLIEAKAIMNASLLDELKDVKIEKKSFKEFIAETKRIIQINEGLLNIDLKQKKEFLDSNEIIYSIILRLRGIFLIKNILEKEKYSKKSFFKYMETEINKDEIDKIYRIYRYVRDKKKIKEKVKIEAIEKLLNLLKREVKE